jgi:uncharacterized membrane protein
MLKTRITSIDTVRGLVMIIMALDHVRDLIHFSALSLDPTNMGATTPGLFFTRWVTHLCAPTFVFLSGVSAYLSYLAAKDKMAAKMFLVKRGLWLVLLEITLVNFGIWFDIDFGIVMLQVIAAIGFGFILLPLLVGLPPILNAMISVGITLLCNVFVGLDFAAYPVLNFLYHLLVSPFLFQVTPKFMLLVNYPVLPWFSIMLAGYACGLVFTKPAEERQRVLQQISFLLLLLFVVVRALNSWGDPSAWGLQKNGVFTFMSFINVSKYPPSPLYVSLTLSIAFFFLFVAEKVPFKGQRILQVYGSVPMFYYLIHFYVIHLAAQLIMLAQGFSWSDFQFEPFTFGRPVAPSGIGLVGVYIFWIGVVAALYPLCKVYAKYKKSHPEKTWLRYL